MAALQAAKPELLSVKGESVNTEICNNPDFHIKDKSNGNVIGSREQTFCVVGKDKMSSRYAPLHFTDSIEEAKKYIREHSAGAPEFNWQYNIKDREGRTV